MKYIIHLKRYLIIIATFLVVILLTGCGVGVVKARKPAGDFSRGLPLPIESSSSPAAAVDPEGKLIQVIVPTERGEEGISFRYFQINKSLETVSVLSFYRQNTDVHKPFRDIFLRLE